MASVSEINSRLDKYIKEEVPCYAEKYDKLEEYQKAFIRLEIINILSKYARKLLIKITNGEYNNER